MMSINPERIRARVRAELSMPVRLGYAALAAAGLSMTGLVLSLVLTEPALPARTQVAFLLIAAAGLAWASHAVWVLRRRRVLLAHHRVRAAQLAVAICAVFFLGALVVDEARGFAALANGVMTMGAAVWYLQARRRRAVLEARRRELELTMGGRS